MFNLISLIFGALGLSALAAWARPSWILARRVFFGAFMLVAVIYWTPLAAWLTSPLERAYPQHVVDGTLNSPLIVHLSGSERLVRARTETDIILNDQNGRYLEALRLLGLYDRSTLVFAGGVKKATTSDRIMSSSFYKRVGLDARVITIGSARNTFENGRDVAAYLKAHQTKKPILLVTSATHMPRAMAVFQTFELNVVAAPAVPTVPTRNFVASWRAHSGRIENFMMFRRAIHEWGGLIYYRLRGRTRSFWPDP